MSTLYIYSWSDNYLRVVIVVEKVQLTYYKVLKPQQYKINFYNKSNFIVELKVIISEYNSFLWST